MQPVRTAGHHQHLLVKQLMHHIKQQTSLFQSTVREQCSDYYALDHQQTRLLVNQVIQRLKASTEGQNLFSTIQQTLAEQATLTCPSETRKYSYLIDCFREATAFPIAEELDNPILQLHTLHGCDTKKELRRVLWSRMWNVAGLRATFSKWDRQVSPFKMQQELKNSIQVTAQRTGMQLRPEQAQNGIRLAEYFMKAQGRLPGRYHYELVLMVVELYSFTKVDKVVDLGAVTLGIVQLMETYKEEKVSRLSNLKLVLSIIDPEGYQLITDNWLRSEQGEQELLQCFELFRLTGGAYHLPRDTSHFLIDQLLIRSHCILDIYSMFAVMLLVMSDDFEPALGEGKFLKTIIEGAKNSVRKEEFIEAYNVVYEQIPPHFDSDHLTSHPNNRLLAHMLASQRPQQSQSDGEPDQAGFVVEAKGRLRIGRPM